jgi:hypothetical protein
MSSLRINFHKSEVLVLGTSMAESSRITNMLNCKDGSFAIAYWVFPLVKLYHLVHWATMCTSKALGGLHILDTEPMNICLMVKCIWNLQNHEQALSADILRAKYLQHKDPLIYKHREDHNSEIPSKNANTWSS